MMLCKDCGKNESEKNGRCLLCFRAERTRQAAVLRSKRREKLIAQNSVLVAAGKQVCIRCVHVRKLTEFSTSLGKGNGKRNKICDRCLSKMYDARGVGFNYTFWRARAYSLNTTARSRLSRKLLRPVSLQELPFVFKPQDLMELFESQKGTCAYCSVELVPALVSVDHMLPLSRGGLHVKSNVCLACRDCNYLKGTRTAKEFKQFVIGYLQRFIK